MYVGVRQSVPCDEGQNAQDRGEQYGLVEDEVGFRLVFPSCGMRYERYGSHAQHLGEGDDHHRDVARCPYPGLRCISHPCYEIKVHQEVEGLEHHPGEDGDGHRDDMAGDGALSEILHVGGSGGSGRPQE